jgi:diadenosine tetraphosphate (Ap4A) HIT family hydrolase
MDGIEGCPACDLAAGRRELPGGRIHETGHWIVEHCVGPLGLGTLLVKPARHVTSVAELDDDEVAEMGPLLQPATTAVIEAAGDYGPALQAKMSDAGDFPRVDHVELFCEQARRSFQSTGTP